MDLGGPVWHASTATPSVPVVEHLKVEALRQLHGVGDVLLGEWHEWSGKAYHVRRRLFAAEQARVGEVVDVRGTPEAWRRSELLGPELLAYAPAEVLFNELGLS